MGGSVFVYAACDAGPFAKYGRNINEASRYTH
jgi:hypothetical protein